MSLPPLNHSSNAVSETSSPYAARRESKEAVLGGNVTPTGGGTGSRKSSRASSSAKNQSFEGSAPSPTKGAPSPTPSGEGLYSKSAPPPEEDLDKIVVRNTKVRGKELEYYGSEQAILNMTVKTAVLDNEESLEAIHDKQIERCINMRQDLYMGNEKRRAALKEFDEGYKWCEPIGLEQNDIINQLGLRISLDAITDLGQPLNVPTIFGISPMLRELLEGQTNKDRLKVIEEELKSTSDQLTSKRLQITDSVMGLYELVNTDVLEYIIKKLKDLEPRVLDLMKQADTCEREREAALKTDNIPLAQERHHESVDILWQLIMCCRERLNEVMLGSHDPDNFRSEFERFQTDVMGSLAQFKVEKENMKEDIAYDLKLLKDSMDQKRQENHLSMEQAREWQHQSNIRLGENAHKQDEVWAQVCAMVANLKKLGEDRTKEVQLHLEMHDREEQRRYEHDEWILINNKHVKVLDEVMRHTDSSIRFIYAIDEYFSQGIQMVQEKRVDIILDEMKSTEQKRYYEVFKKFCTVTDELIDRKEKRMNGLIRMIRNTEYQSEMAIETLDNDGEKYKTQLDELYNKKEHTAKVITRLQANLDRAMADFQESEPIMEQLGIEYEPPALEISQKQIKRRRDFLEKRKLFLEREQTEIELDQTDIRKANSKQSVEAETFARRKSDKERRKAERERLAAQRAAEQAGGRPSTAPLDESEQDAGSPLAQTFPAR